MSDSNRRDRGALVALGLALLTIISVAWLSQPSGQIKVQSDVHQVEQSQKSDSSQSITPMDGSNPWDDTYAQWLMAVFSVIATGVSFFAVILVRDTLNETRRIGQAQVRAYLADDGFNVEWGTVEGGRAIITNIEGIWKNTGQSPALSCGLEMLLHGLLPEDVGKPIPASAGALKSLNLGTISIASGGRALCGGPNLDADDTADWLEGRTSLVVHLMATYKDVFGNLRRTETCHQIVHVKKASGNTVRFKIYPLYNSAT